ncbi:MAG: hypothetical protein Q9220_007623 [cf. Caloplaca sp. 1 TL-2023]
MSIESNERSMRPESHHGIYIARESEANLDENVPVRWLYLEREERRATASDPPATMLGDPIVTWTAKVYDDADNPRSRRYRPRIIFKDNQPLALTLSTANDQLLAARELNLGTRSIPSWEGCVLDVMFNCSQDDRLRGQVGDAESLHLEKEHVRHLYEFLKPRHETQVVSTQRYLGRSRPLIAYDMLWYLFRPGTDVYIWVDSLPFACVVDRVQKGHEEREDIEERQTTFNAASWNLDLWNLDTDGARVARSKLNRTITAYAGYREVVTLPVCPTAIWDTLDNGEQRRAIMKRSKLHFKALHQGYLEIKYEGPVDREKQYAGTFVIDPRRGLLRMKHEPPVFDRIYGNAQYYKGYDNLIVNTEGVDDPTTVTKPGFEPSNTHKTLAGSGPHVNRSLRNSEMLSNSSHVHHATISVTKDLSDHQLFLLSPMTRAFALKTKEWCEFV